MNKRPSYEKINYMLRPRKQIERKILIELFQKLQNYNKKINLVEYHYIGLGSVYYYDFILFHKFLNINKMISLDKENTKKRFEFNKPYDFIEFRNVSTTDFLLNYNFKDKLLIWLDYDSMLYDIKDDAKNDSILNDIEEITKKSKVNDFFILTIDVTCPENPEQKQNFLNCFDIYISSKFKKEKFIYPLHYHCVIQDILLNYIEEHQKFQDVKFRKLFSFNYKDSAYMYTLGGIYDESDKFQKSFSNETFVTINKEKIINIDVPILTYREKLYLDSEISKLKKRIVRNNKEKLLNSLEFEIRSLEELKSYLTYYKYYPQYFEGII